jgi:mRNA interferase RelE/StbE
MGFGGAAPGYQSEGHAPIRACPEGTAAAIVEFMLTALTENPHRVGARLRRELAGLHSARRGAYRVDEINTEQRAVIVLRVDHRPRVHRSR